MKLPNPIKYIRNHIRLDNAEPSAIKEIGFVDYSNEINEDSIDWNQELPRLIKPTIQNCRACFENSTVVKGIIEDLVIKSISGYELEAEPNAPKGALEYIQDEAERLDFMSLFHEVAINNIVSGAMYHNVVKKNGQLYLRELAFDGENYRIKEIYDDYTGSEIIGYKQRVLKNRNTNKDWLKKDFFDLNEELEAVEFNFQPNEVIASHFFERNGEYHNLISSVLDEAYMLGLLTRMMPQVVYKQAITTVLSGGNKDKQEVNIGKRIINKAVNALTNYHRKGVVYLPFGLDVKLIGNPTLPSIQDYITKLEYLIFVGLVSPKAIFDGSSSNRSTAVVQLDSDKSGRVLFQQFIQGKVDHWGEEVINILLEMRGYPKGCIKINFNPQTNENDETILNENGNVSTAKSGDGLNLNNIENTGRGASDGTA